MLCFCVQDDLHKSVCAHVNPAGGLLKGDPSAPIKEGKDDTELDSQARGGICTLIGGFP